MAGTRAADGGGSPLAAGAPPLRCALPIDRWLALASGRSLPDTSRGVALIADISGFTALTNRLTSALGPKLGAEVLSSVVTSVFDGLATDVHLYGGSIVGIAGDAITCWVDEHPILAEEPVPAAAARALASATAMQYRVRELAVSTAADGAPADLSLRVGLAAGKARRFLVGDPDLRLMDVLAGAPVNRAAAACRRAAPGEVVASRELLVPLTSGVHVADMGGHFARVESVEINVPALCWPHLPDDAVAPETARRWHHPTVLDHLNKGGWLLGDLRRAAVVFLRLPEVDFDDPGVAAALDAVVRSAQQMLAGLGGTLIDIALDEKGTYLAAVVGGPISFPDHARRAVDAALGLCSSLGSGGAQEGVRVGLEDGRVWAGMSGTRLRAAYVVRGGPVNLAARLMERAGPGQILVGPAMARALKNSYVLVAHGDIEVKGWVAPVATWRILGRSAISPGPPAVLAPLVGRQAEFGLLTSAMTAVLEGGSRVVAISGEPGIGKSRLLEAGTDAAQSRGLRVLAGWGNAVEQSSPYRAWTPVFEALFGVWGRSPTDAELERILQPLGDEGTERAPLLSAVLPVSLHETEATRWMSPDARQESTQRLLMDLFQAHCEAGSVMLLMDDAQWLDSASWTLLVRLARTAHRLVVLVAARTEAETQRRLRSLLSIPGAVGVQLSPLTPADSLSAVCQSIGIDALPEPVSQLVNERAEGNPFFGLELVYALRDAGVLEIGSGSCRLVEGGHLNSLGVPATVDGVIANRVDRLPPDTQAALKVGSVLGLPFSARTIANLGGSNIGSEEHLVELEARDLIVSDGSCPDPNYTFKHALVREVVYDRLLETQRQHLHHRAAEHYERAGLVARGSLAHHWEQAGVIDKALEHLELAGQDALREGAFSECVDLLERAASLAEAVERPAVRRASRPITVSPLRLARWRWQAAQAHYRLGGLARSRELAEQAVAVFDRRLPGTGIWLTVLLVGQAVRQLVHRLFSKPVLSRLGPADSGRLQPAARAYLNLAELYYLASQKTRSAYAALRGLNVAELAGPSLELAEAYGAIAIISGLVGRYGLAARYLHLGFQAADKLGAPYGRAIVLHQASMHRSGIGDFESVYRDEEEAAALFRRLGDKGRLRDCLAIAGVAAEQAGRLELAERLMAELLSTREGDEGFLHEVWARTWLGAVASRRGHLEQAVEHLRYAAAMQSSALLDANAVTIHGVLALALWKTGRPAEARQEAERARSLIATSDGQPTVHGVLDGYAALAEVSLGFWDAAETPVERNLWRGRANEACRFLRIYSRVFPIGEPARWLFEGERQSRFNRSGKALRAWQRSLASSEQLNMSYELQRARQALGAT